MGVRVDFWAWNAKVTAADEDDHHKTVEAALDHYMEDTATVDCEDNLVVGGYVFDDSTKTGVREVTEEFPSPVVWVMEHREGDVDQAFMTKHDITPAL